MKKSPLAKQLLAALACGASRYYSEDAFKKLTGNNKELYIVPGAVQTVSRSLKFSQSAMPLSRKNVLLQ